VPALLGAAVALVALPGAVALLRRRWLAAGGVALLLVAAVVLTRPAAPAAQSAPARIPFAGGQAFVDLAVAPASAGANHVYVTVLARDDSPARGVSYTAVLNSPGGKGKPVSVRDGQVMIPRTGEWELALTVRPADGAEETIYGVVDVAD